MKKDDKKDKELGMEIRDHLQSEFQKMQPKEAAPEGLKKQVFDTLDTIQLMADVADLFTVKFSKTESEVVELLGGKEGEKAAEKGHKEADEEE